MPKSQVDLYKFFLTCGDSSAGWRSGQTCAGYPRLLCAKEELPAPGICPSAPEEKQRHIQIICSCTDRADML